MGSLKAKNCLSCGAKIYWVRSEAGKAMPLEPIDGPVFTIRSGDLGVAVAQPVKAFRSHFATCPDADAWRGKSRSEPS